MLPQILPRLAGIIQFGTFSTYIQLKQIYGPTIASRLFGMMMDIDRMQQQVTDKDNTLDNLRAFLASQGVRKQGHVISRPT